MENKEGNYTIALLIDSDNVSAQYLGVLSQELESLGHVTVKRIYGDFTKTTASQWKDVLLRFGITPVQQFAYTTGKNATDSTMIIDAMDILYGGNVDAFCLATSDSDFTRLAARLKESGMFVIGAGEKKTPKSFVGTCDRFLMLDALFKAVEKPKKQTAKAEKPAKSKDAAKEKQEDMKEIREKSEESVRQRETEEEAVELPKEAEVLNRMRQLVGEDWTLFSSAVHDLYKTYPQFNYKFYQKENLKQFFESKFEFKKQDGTSIDLIRRKAAKKPNA